MRPIKLELEGFGSFRLPTTFDFDGIDYFALVGPTGNGKSTVIDAICFALYGKVARHDDRSVVSNIVSLNAIEARVRFTFSAGGTEFVAVRAVKLRKGSPKHDARLERADGDVLAASVREFTTAIEHLLGLSFDDFTRCVALPQGEFQRFLHEEPAKRRSVLVRLLNLGHYERMGQRAREHAARLHERQALLREQHHKLAAISDDDELRAKELVLALDAVAADLHNAMPRDAALSETISTLDTTIAVAQQSIQALAGIEIPESAATLTADDLASRAALVTAQADVSATLARVTATEAEIGAVGDVAVIEGSVALWAQHRETAAGLAARDEEVRAVSSDAAAAQLALTDAQARQQAADAELERVRNENRAHVLRAELHDGDICPVCAQLVAHAPHAVEPPAYTVANTAAQQASEATATAERAHKRVMAALQQAQGAQASVREQFTRLESQVRDLASPDTLAEQQSSYAKLQQQLFARREAHQRAGASERSAAQAVEDCTRSAQEFQAAFDRQRDAVAQLQPPQRDASDLLGSWNALAVWATAQHESVTENLDTLGSERTRHATEQQELRTSFIERVNLLNVEARDFAQLPTALATAQTRAEHAVANFAQQRAAVAELDTQVAAVGAEHAIAKMVGDLLRNDGFLSWLVEEALVALIRDASVTLLELSAGQYSLRQGTTSDFEIVDHTNGDQPRPVRSLSGGETFQASLALALALSDQLADLAAEGAPKLEAIFLDEGFGTLDPESLDTVATTLETLGTSGRMVGVVTHVRELAERIPVRFEITKINNTSHVEVVTA